MQCPARGLVVAEVDEQSAFDIEAVRPVRIRELAVENAVSDLERTPAAEVPEPASVSSAQEGSKRVVAYVPFASALVHSVDYEVGLTKGLERIVVSSHPGYSAGSRALPRFLRATCPDAAGALSLGSV